MCHKFYFEDSTGGCFQKTSSLVAIGDDAQHTAMANTVGLPMGIAAKLVLNGTIKLKGLQLPVTDEIYNPVLNELNQFGISFNEHTESIDNNYENQPVF